MILETRHQTSEDGKSKGFTLIETLVAITILTVAISGSLFAANSTIVAASISRDRLIASYLAQESIERVRWTRDHYYLGSYPSGNSPSAELGTAWGDFLTRVSGCSTKCDPMSFGLDATPAPFTRTLQIAPVTGRDEKVVSTVSWSYHGTQYSVKITDHLTPWQ